MEISEHFGEILVAVRKLKEDKHIIEPDQFVKVNELDNYIDEVWKTFKQTLNNKE